MQRLQLLIATGDDVIDSYAPALSRALVGEFGADVAPEVARALVSILHNEAPRGRPYSDAAGIVGDASLGGGPSVGPLQVYRRTAKDLGLWKPSRIAAQLADQGDDSLEREEYAALANDVPRCLAMGAAVFAEKLRIARGDVEKAVRLYNGSGEAAEAYRDRATRYASSVWGADPFTSSGEA